MHKFRIERFSQLIDWGFEAPDILGSRNGTVCWPPAVPYASHQPTPKPEMLASKQHRSLPHLPCELELLSVYPSDRRGSSLARGVHSCRHPPDPMNNISGNRRPRFQETVDK